MPCAIVALLSLCLYLLCFGLMVGTWSWPYGLSSFVDPTSKGLDHPYFHVYACLLLCFMLVLAFLVQGFATLDSLRGFVVVWLHLTPMRPCLDVTSWDASPWCRLFRAHLSPFPLHVKICLLCLFVPPVGFICIFTRLLTCPCVSLAC